MGERLTGGQRACLKWYADHEHAPDCPVPYYAKWNMRQVNILLGRNLLEVGDGGWHVPSEAGREALKARGE